MSKQSRLNKEKAQKAKADSSGGRSPEGSQKISGASPTHKRSESAPDHTKGEKREDK